MKKILAVMMFLGLGASNAYAVGQCAALCPGPSEPCSLKCELDNGFVTTCKQVYGGICVRAPAAEAEAEEVCVAEPTLEPIVAALVEVGTSAFEAVLG